MRLNIYSMNTIDLHGVKHEDVSRLLDSFLWQNMQKKIKEVRVITGNSDEMKRIVRETLSDYGFSSEEEYFNSGALIVKM
jgi:DNA-nicking Smr family endonuclease